NLPAVWLRHTQLRSLYRQGLLTDLQHGALLDDVVFSLAAGIPMKGTHLDTDDFIRRLRSTATPQSANGSRASSAPPTKLLQTADSVVTSSRSTRATFASP